MRHRGAAVEHAGDPRVLRQVAERALAARHGPAAGSVSPPSTRNRLVLPAPLRPTRPTLSRGMTVKSADSTTSRPPTSTESPWAWSTRSGCQAGRPDPTMFGVGDAAGSRVARRGGGLGRRPPPHRRRPCGRRRRWRVGRVAGSTAPAPGWSAPEPAGSRRMGRRRRRRGRRRRRPARRNRCPIPSPTRCRIGAGAGARPVPDPDRCRPTRPAPPGPSPSSRR